MIFAPYDIGHCCSETQVPSCSTMCSNNGLKSLLLRYWNWYGGTAGVSILGGHVRWDVFCGATITGGQALTRQASWGRAWVVGPQRLNKNSCYDYSWGYYLRGFLKVCRPSWVSEWWSPSRAVPVSMKPPRLSYLRWQNQRSVQPGEGKTSECKNNSMSNNTRIPVIMGLILAVGYHCCPLVMHDATPPQKKNVTERYRAGPVRCVHSR